MKLIPSKMLPLDYIYLKRKFKQYMPSKLHQIYTTLKRLEFISDSRFSIISCYNRQVLYIERDTKARVTSCFYCYRVIIPDYFEYYPSNLIAEYCSSRQCSCEIWPDEETGANFFFILFFLFCLLILSSILQLLNNCTLRQTGRM
jgi:hypothetical protein